MNFNIKYNNISKVILGILFVWIAGGFLITIIEPNSFNNIRTALWWAIVSMTTVGYGDYTPKTDLGRFLAILIMFFGISLIAIVTATISSVFTTKKIMEGKGLENIHLKNHIILCGWNSNIANVINILSKSMNNKVSIVLINDQTQEKIDNLLSTYNNLNIKFVRGDYSIESILEKACINEANYALLLNSQKNNEDEKIILTTLALKKISPKLRVIAQINNKNKASFLKRANADAILSNEEFNSFMASSHILQPSVAQAINNIVDYESSNHIVEKIIPEEFVGKPFSELHNHYFNTTGSICLGLFNNEESMGISDFLSSDSSALDKFIEKKLKRAGHSLNEKNNVNINLNPNKNTIIHKGQGALLLK